MQWWSVIGGALQSTSMSSAMGWSMSTAGDSWTSGRLGNREEERGMFVVLYNHCYLV